VKRKERKNEKKMNRQTETKRKIEKIQCRGGEENERKWIGKGKKINSEMQIKSEKIKIW